jgi:hypothetical protein
MKTLVLIRIPQKALIHTVLIEVGSTKVRYIQYLTHTSTTVLQDRPGEETGGVLLAIFPGETALLVCPEMQPHRLCCRMNIAQLDTYDLRQESCLRSLLDVLF